MSLIQGVTLIPALVTLALVALAVRAAWRNHLLGRQLECALLRDRSEAGRRRLERLERRNRKKLMEESVHGGTTAVEALHRTITGVTFDLVDRYSTSDEFRAKARRAREVHDDTTRSLYRAIRSTNRVLHVLGDMVGQRGKDEDKSER
ncbi:MULTISPECIES: hypothetical protein [Marinobacter]|uniref:hypothetical protein n=1 Tax=Marinobacter TaxID=2742 RepID=UPI001D05CC27|nr:MULTISPECIES: hypothetical protein [Marinobacter]MCG8517218.1 hypothetical protein [Pseudomonadales bacterium]MCK7566244.1 hypothetical protein [Marinobacter xestospongiae]UDL07118.1 hypothetical protein J2887_10355 [Marinobacter sp. CA1]